MSVFARFGYVAFMSLFAVGVFAQTQSSSIIEQQTAHDIVRNASQQVMELIELSQEYVEEDPARYYAGVHEILDPVIDYRGFARGIMGSYASRSRYESLGEAGREKLRNQLEQFTAVIRVGLIRTYGKGLLAFGGSRVEVSQPAPDEASQNRVSVRQLIYSEEAQPYVVMYQMGRNKSGQWKLRNVIIETVNLGAIYKNQFQAAARKNNGDLDAVIGSWSTVALES